MMVFNVISHRIHVWDWYICLHEWLEFMVNVGKYTSPMDPMGFFTDRIMKVHSSNLI